MGCLKICLGLILLVAAITYQQYLNISSNFPRPDFDPQEYWGKGEADKYKEDEAIRPFKVSYSDNVINKLKSRLEDADPFPEPLEGVAFEYGFNSKRLQEIVNFWKDSYLPKWEERQKFLNQFTQYKTQIQGLNIHFLHVKPSNVNKDTKVFKLLLLHGWPGSVREFYEIIPMLTTPNKDNIAFEVIAPSLPGFGFSDGSAKQGLTPEKIAIIMRNLMLRIGIDKFYIQGGDWGSVIGSSLAALYPENVLGYHTNFMGIRTPLSAIKTAIASFYPSYFIEDEKHISWMYPFSNWVKFALQESGYFHVHVTKPDTIGLVISNNPIGLAIWLLDKVPTVTNKAYVNRADGGFGIDIPLEALIDNVMIYYLSNSAVTAIRIYKEMLTTGFYMERVAVEVPTGAAYFKHEIQHQFSFLTQERFKKLIHNSYFDQGGHFAALELPKILYEDFVEFVKKTL